MARGSISLASHSGRASADGSPRLADGGSCHAYAVNAGPAYAAGGSDLRNHAVWLNNRRWCHRLRRYRNRQGEASNGDQLNHFLLPNGYDHLTSSHTWGCPVVVFKQRKAYRRIAGRLAIDQGHQDD